MYKRESLWNLKEYFCSEIFSTHSNFLSRAIVISRICVLQCKSERERSTKIMGGNFLIDPMSVRWPWTVRVNLILSIVQIVGSSSSVWKEGNVQKSKNNLRNSSYPLYQSTRNASHMLMNICWKCPHVYCNLFSGLTLDHNNASYEVFNESVNCTMCLFR